MTMLGEDARGSRCLIDFEGDTVEPEQQQQGDGFPRDFKGTLTNEMFTDMP